MAATSRSPMAGFQATSRPSATSRAMASPVSPVPRAADTWAATCRPQAVLGARIAQGSNSRAQAETAVATSSSVSVPSITSAASAPPATASRRTDSAGGGPSVNTVPLPSVRLASSTPLLTARRQQGVVSSATPSRMSLPSGPGPMASTRGICLTRTAIRRGFGAWVFGAAMLRPGPNQPEGPRFRDHAGVPRRGRRSIPSGLGSTGSPAVVPPRRLAGWVSGRGLHTQCGTLNRIP